jgi:hypothetical protein
MAARNRPTSSSTSTPRRLAPADVMTIGPLLEEVKAAFRAYEKSRGRLPGPLMDVPRVMSRFD